MKTLEDHILLYDQDCPLCQAYSGAFIQVGMLQHEGRQNWSSRSEAIDKLIDTQKSRNEIALVNSTTGKVYYGAESLVTIIGNSFSIFNKAWEFKFIRTLVNILYHFISYNRHIVIPRKAGTNTCEPDFNLTWRIVFILLMSLFSSFTLSKYFSNIEQYPFKNQGFAIELGIIVIHFAIQYFIIRNKSIQTIADYLGNNAFVSFLGSIALLIINLSTDNVIIKLILFVLVACVMLFEHKRRVELLNLPQTLTFAWLGFRALLGAVILITVF